MTLEPNKLSDTLAARIINSLPYGMIVVDTKGEFTFWNDRATPLLSDRPQDNLKAVWEADFGAYSVDTKERLQTSNLPMIRALNGESVVKEKIYIKNAAYPDGIYLKISAYPVVDGDGKSAVIIFEDITKEQELYDKISSEIASLESYLLKELGVDFKLAIKEHSKTLIENHD